MTRVAGDLCVAVGSSRLQKVYKNELWTWEQLVSKLESPRRTEETLSEYVVMTKEAQAKVKDVGGFVGGRLKNGSRKSVEIRSLVCLDLDYAKPDVWMAWLTKYSECRGAMYSTHSSTPDKPRFRLVIPLARPVTPDEYEPVARRIAEELGMEQFDPTTFEAGRMMYWPSVAKDARYVFEQSAGGYLDPDCVLESYANWRDVTSWPGVAGLERNLREHTGKKMQSVLDKRGLVGAFCRAYNIHEAIAQFVPDYKPSEEIPGRYTYTKGSTANGVVIYDEMFSFSFHATDPAGGRECNAFDLVRIHLYGDQDKSEPLDAAVNKLPSYRAMCELASKDERCKAVLQSERQAVVAAFDAESGDEAEDDDNYNLSAKLELSLNGKPAGTSLNIQRILRHDPKLRGCFGHDLFACRDVMLRPLPWRTEADRGKPLEDIDDAHIRVYFDTHYSITAREKIWDCTQAECARHRYHPVRRYLEGLHWDGVRRLDTALIDYFGCDDTEYVRAITRKTLLGAVMRVFEPGSQFDTMLTLKGPQGCGKSTFFRRLSKGWYSDSLKDIRTKDALEGLQGVWIIEMGELASLKKTDAEIIKSFLSGRSDRFRAAYGRRTTDYPRQCIFVATTNESDFLRDRTGNRRFWVVDVPKDAQPKKDVFRIPEEEVDQLWAEAKAIYEGGTETVVLPPELVKEAIEMQEAFMQADPRAEQIIEYLERKLPEKWADMDVYERIAWLDSDEEGVYERTKVCAKEVWREALRHPERDEMKRHDAVEINSILDSLPDWKKNKKPIRVSLYGLVKGFIRITSPF